jgi:hypothetical protein
MKKVLGVFAALCFCIISPLSFAGQGTSSNNILDKVNNQFGITASGKYFKYEEAGLMKSYGIMPGIDVFSNNTFGKNFYFAANLGYHAGTSTYDGGIYHISPTTLTIEPYSTKNEKFSVFHTDIKLGYIVHQANNSQLIPYLGIGTRTYRTSTPFPSFVTKRTTRNGHYLIGAIYNIAVNDNLVVSPEVSIGSTFGGKVGYDECSNLSNRCYNYDLNDGIYYSLGVKANYFVTDNISVNGAVGYKHYKFGKSKNQHLRQYGYVSSEPKSTNDDFSAGLGLSYHF